MSWFFATRTSAVLAFVVMVVWAAPVSKIEAMKYLQQFGYMDENNTTVSALVSAEAVTSAIKDFQKFAGLPTTGKLDVATANMMDKPRCGVKDKAGDYGSVRRKKRYALQGSRWHRNELHYRIIKYPSRLQNRELVDKEIDRALKVWSDVTNLKFVKDGIWDLVHLDVGFVTGDHGDGLTFDGLGDTLAHAFFPHCGSDAHFDDEEQWTVGEEQGTNLFQVAAHEFGHSLGLEHSDVPNSVMAPFYDGYDPKKKLSRDDILSIQALYGRPNRSPPIAPHPRARGDPDPNGPNLCKDPTLDAATVVDDGRAFVFKGDHYWEVEETGVVGGPRKISDDWDGMPGNVDAAITLSNGKTYFFKGDMFYRFRNQRLDSGYPKLIHVEFKGIPNDLDAAFIWSGNGKAYFFKGDIYWRYDNCKNPPIPSRFPLRLDGFVPELGAYSYNAWNGLPNNIDAALQWGDQKTYFFKGTEFFKFNDKTNMVDERLSTADAWLHCNSE